MDKKTHTITEVQNHGKKDTYIGKGLELSDLREDGNSILHGEAEQKWEDDRRKEIEAREGMLQEPQYENCSHGGESPSAQPKTQYRRKKHELEGWKKDNELRICLSSGAAGSPDTGQKERNETIYCGTSPSDGNTSGSLFGGMGESSSSKRGKERQPDRKFGTGEFESSHGSSNMPSLPSNIFNKIDCPHCGSYSLKEMVCEHIWQSKHTIWHGDRGKGTHKEVFTDISEQSSDSQFCSLCNAWRGELGLEPTFQLYLDHLLSIFAEVKRVLKPTGTCWVNVGDSYSSSGTAGGNGGFNERWYGVPYASDKQAEIERPKRNLCGIPPKSLYGIPERFAIRMTDELGMIRRNTIIWYKRNCMPSSVSDRFTVDFEPIYFFSKSGKYYFKQQLENRLWFKDDKRSKIPGGVQSNGKCSTGIYATNNVAYRQDGKRNRRCVWDIPTKSSNSDHYATFPDTLVSPMLDAGCPPDGIVCDPFSGMGTVAKTAIKQGKKFIGIELSEEYHAKSEKQIKELLQQLTSNL